MKRVLLGGMKHETVSFVPGVATLETFRNNHLVEGADVFGPARGTGQEIDGTLAIAQQEDIELIPTIDAFGGAAPVVADAAYEYMRDRILAGARENAGRIDGVMLPLHGAMSTESLEDPEGDLITRVRELVGPQVPIVVSFDMHCHLTDLSVRPADAIVGYHTHPHVDFFDTGQRAMRILVRALKGEIRPVVMQRKTRMIASAERHNTSQGPMKEVMDRILAMEQEPGILAATVFATQPWMDMTELGWSTVVVADGDRALAQARADELARMLWDRRERFLVRKTPIEEVIAFALAGEKKPVVVTDSADSVSGGGYGDGNLLLRALLAAGYQDTALLTVTDPQAVATCFAAGVGARLTLPVGGRLTPAFYQPVQVAGYVKTLTDGDFQAELPPMPVHAGRTAVFQAGGITLVLSERPAMTIDREVYHSSGLRPRNFKLVQVKSPGGFRAIYSSFAAAIFELDTPGPTDSDLTRLPFRRIRRPLWPFDPDLQEPW